MFFGFPIDLVSIGGKALMLMLAVLFGGLIGLEREWHGNPAGMRTHILVCVGSTVITLTSVEIGMGIRGGTHGDPGHIAAQIVSGVGFLGAGAIVREGATVRGLTTAASIWATAGIGIALGGSPRLGELAVVATLIVLVTLSLLTRVETFLKARQRVLVLQVEVAEAKRGPSRVLDTLAKNGVEVYGVESEATPVLPGGQGNAQTRQMRIRVRLPRGMDRHAVSTLLTEEEGITSFHTDR